ncbi:MAG: Imidazole glycerol phosphate synthase amidotransferase subunit [uncultured Thermomicrobiales bacterium]|uniref:Imidazole glycerol phosphate synthase subunit HisH n=1 Tax=uncultured Thermomicrobiales bacterium TaxID=1645740 RepID=A0A6J4UQK7_9BACT|nr:MAG: Imidazole glycerol phosphate synthase amidotransferase subunit [uncultured Thermomicrobiales bacterium]
MIAVIDYGAGNLRSIRRALEAAGSETVVTADPAVVAQADAVVLPGVGAAAHAMDRLNELGMTPVVRDAVAAGKPFLGICLGMQILFEHQEEGDSHGLGLLRGRVRSLVPDAATKVPHIGWNRSRVVAPGPLGAAGDERHYYFVHSYVVEPDDPADVAAETDYGVPFPSVVVRNNIWGTQFHPEKSGPDGLALIAAFVAVAGECTPVPEPEPVAAGSAR